MHADPILIQYDITKSPYHNVTLMIGRVQRMGVVVMKKEVKVCIKAGGHNFAVRITNFSWVMFKGG